MNRMNNYVSHLLSKLGKKSFKNLFLRALVIFFTGLALRSLILYVFDTNVFLHPLATISLIYYGYNSQCITVYIAINP